MRVRQAHAALIVAAFLALAPGAPGAPAAAAESGLWSAGSTTLRSGPSGYVAATAGGERRLALPAGVEVEELFALGQRAFLSGRQAPQRSAPGDTPSRDLYLALIDAEGLHPLPSPAAGSENGRLRENALPLVSDADELEGLAWLEGTDRQSYAVRVGRDRSPDLVRGSHPRREQRARKGARIARASCPMLPAPSQARRWQQPNPATGAGVPEAAYAYPSAVYPPANKEKKRTLIL